MAALNIVLLRASSLLLCMALFCVFAAPEPGATGGEIYPIDNKAFRQVSEYLATGAKSYDFDVNAKLIDEYSKSDEFAQEQDRGVKELVNLLDGIEKSDESMCGEANLVHVKTVLDRVKDAAPGIAKSIHSDPWDLHLTHVLRNYIGKIYRHCFRPAEEKFFMLEQHHTLDPDFKWFDALNQVNGQTEYWSEFDNMNMLYGAANLATSGSEAAGKFVRDLIAYINDKDEVRPSIANHPKSGEAVHPSYKLAEDHLNKDIIEPCRKLLDMESTQTILVPISHIAMIINLSNFQVSTDSRVLQWAGRTINCKWILGMNREELIKSIVSAKPVDMEQSRAAPNSLSEELGDGAANFMASLISRTTY